MRLNKVLAFLAFGVIFGFFVQTVSAYYSPEVGRFISRDPIGYEAGDVNVYRYVSSNPITYNDPSGLACCDSTEYDPTTQGCCDKTIYDLATQCCKNKLIKTKFLLCIRCYSDHCWIYAKDFSSGNEHTYGRWRIGYGTATHSGVQIDAELKRSYSCERCTQVCDYKPTLGNGYGWYANNCASYAQSEWMRLTGEILNATAWYSGDHPTALCKSIVTANGGNHSNSGGSCAGGSSGSSVGSYDSCSGPSGSSSGSSSSGSGSSAGSSGGSGSSGSYW